MTSGYPTVDALVGAQLGDYRLLRVVATGGMARIYEAEDARLGRRAAVKVLAQEKLDGDPTLLQRFEREARAIAALDHPNIIPIYRYGEQDGVRFLAMKLVRGHDLAQELLRLRRLGQRLPPDRALHILAQVASALDYAHACEVLHRDVKPSNILLDAGDQAILTDFGLVMHQRIDTTLGTAFGTPRYISPEQAISSSRAVPQSDLYSLAVIAYEILAGEPPFNGLTPMEVAMHHLHDAPPPPRDLNPDIPEAAEAELLRALAKDPERRHATVSEFIAALRSAYDLPPDWTQTIITVPPTPVLALQPVGERALLRAWDDPAAAPPARKKRFWLVSLALLVLLAAGAVYLALQSSAGADMPAPTTSPLSLAAVTAEPSVPVQMPGGAAPVTLDITYNEIELVLVNTAEEALNAPLIRFTAGTTSYDLALPGGSLPPGACARIMLQNRQPAVAPSCPPVPHALALEGAAARLFWRAETTDMALFGIALGDNILANCPTISRGEANSCSLTVGPPPENPA